MPSVREFVAIYRDEGLTDVSRVLREWPRVDRMNQGSNFGGKCIGPLVQLSTKVTGP